MHEPVVPPEETDLPEGDSTDALVMVSSATGAGRRQARRIGALIVVAMVVLLLISSSAAWVPTVQRQWARIFPPPPYTGGVVVVAEQSENTLWGLRSGSGQPQWSYKPVITNDSTPIQVGAVVVADDPTGIVGLRATDGKVLWHVNAPQNHALAQLYADDAQRFFAWFPASDSQEQSLYEALDVQRGTLLWQMQRDGYPIIPLHSGKVLYCMATPLADGTMTRRISAFDDATGRLLWQSPTVHYPPSQGASCYATASLAFIEQLTGNVDDVTALDLTNGALTWHLTLPDQFAFSDDQHIYATNWFIDQSSPSAPLLGGYDAPTGKALWQTPGQFTVIGIDTSQRRIVPFKTATGIAGVDVSTGVVQWRFAPPDDTLQFWLASFGDNNQLLYSVGGHVYALDVLTGRVMWARATAVDASGVGQRGLTYRDHRLYLATAANLAAYDAATGRLLWQIPKSYYLLD